jgi:DNA modification methylase
MDYTNLPAFYTRLDSKYKITNADIDAATYTNVDSNFVLSSNYPRHRWFNYKEGFSPVLVERIFKEYGLTTNSVVCDPFCGAGTTLAVAKAQGMFSIGFEVNPFAAFVTKVKTTDYDDSDIEAFKSIVDGLKGLTIDYDIPLPENDYLKRIFDEEMLHVQLTIREFIKSLAEEKPQQLLYFAWLSTLEDCSLFRKAGNGLKLKTHPPVYGSGGSFAFAINRIYEKATSMIEDYTKADNGPTPLIYEESVTTLNRHVQNGSLDLVLFSPPYANCFDYTKIYYLELWFGGFVNSTADQKDIRMKSLRSHCHATWPDRYTSFHLDELNDDILPLLRRQKLWTARIPDMLNGYFADMEEALRQIYDALSEGGHCAIVVSNSAYAGIIIPTDVFLAMIAQRLGFTVEEIEVERLIITSSQQYKRTEHIRHFLRESIVKLKK